jgi:hypothetical protein
MPPRRVPRARLEVGNAEAADEREARERRCGVPFDVRSVGDEGAKPVAEDAAEIVDEALRC